MVKDVAVSLQMTVRTRSPEETRAVGRALGVACRGGEVFLLRGDLGSGKTCFVQGLAAGLGVETRVTSPTFTLHGEYQGRLILNHLDLYRLDEGADLSGLGIVEMLGEGGAVTAVEWPELLAGYCGPRLELALSDCGEGERELVFTAYGVVHARLLER